MENVSVLISCVIFVLCTIDLTYTLTWHEKANPMNVNSDFHG